VLQCDWPRAKWRVCFYSSIYLSKKS